MLSCIGCKTQYEPCALTAGLCCVCTDRQNSQIANEAEGLANASGVNCSSPSMEVDGATLDMPGFLAAQPNSSTLPDSFADAYQVDAADALYMHAR